MSQITPDQIIVLGVLSSFVAEGLKILSGRLGATLDRKWATGILAVLSLTLALAWNPGAIPALPALTGDAMAVTFALTAWAGQLVQALTPIMGFAMALYNLLLEKVFALAGDAISKVLEKSSKDTEPPGVG